MTSFVPSVSGCMFKMHPTRIVKQLYQWSRVSRRCHSAVACRFSNYFTRKRCITNDTLLSNRAQLFGKSVYTAQAAFRKLSDSRTEAGVQRIKYDADWSLREVYVTTCYDMWNDRPQGIELIVSYIDTAATILSSLKEQLPTILVLPSGLNNDAEWTSFLQALVGCGFRLIIPYWPGSNVTRGATPDEEEHFSNLVGERAAFVLDFLASLDVSRVDVAIGESLSCLPITVIASYFPAFSSVALIRPLPGHVPVRLIEPVWLTRRMLTWSFSWLRRPIAWLWFLLFWRPKASKCLPHASINNAPLDMKAMTFILSILHGYQFDVMASQAMLMESRRIPVLFVHTDDNRLAEDNAVVEYAELLGISLDQWTSHSVPDSSRNVEGKRGDSSGGGGGGGEILKQKGRYVRGLRLSTLSEANHWDTILSEIQTLYENRSKGAS